MSEAARAIPELVDTREVAALLGRDPAEVAAMVRSGDGPPVYGKAARGVPLFRKGDVEAYLADPVASVRVQREARVAMLSRTHHGREDVYFLRDPSGFIKIGTSRNVAQRIIDIQIANPRELALVVTFPGDQIVELEVHALFAEHRERGEWFRDVPEIEAFAWRIKRGDNG